MVEVRLLGGLSVTVEGRPVELPADARARELLARLALSPGLHPRSALAGRLRPDVPEESARKTLRNALYELRRSLGAAGSDAIVVAGEQVGLSDAVRVDVAEFRRRLADGDLEGAAEAGPGELLPGFDGDWAMRARDEHAADLAGVLTALTARAEDAGDFAAALGWARRRLDVEPLAEAAHRELIRLLALSGDRPAALAAARSLGERLRTELGIAPSAATRALVEDVRRGRVVTDAAVAEAPLPGALALGERPEGREAELARLERAWAEAAFGARRFALVTGEPGIGKTTVAAELARRAHASGAAVVLGRSDEDALVPFQPWIEALEQLLQALPAAEADHWLTLHDGALARLLPARSAGQDSTSRPRDRYLAFESARALLDEVGARRPVLLVLDDAQWADADSLSLLRHLARAAPRARLLVLLCARTAELAPAVAQTLADLRREGPVVEIGLQGLDEEAVAALVERHTGEPDHAAGLRYRERSGGNPFFVVELLREARETGADGPPAGVRDVIARRLDRLDERTRRTLEAAAVCGLSFDAAIVSGVQEQPVAEVLEALDGAIDAALVGPAGASGRYEFAHALIAETIASLLPASRRARLHEQVAGVLAGRHEAGEAGAGDVVRHLRGAGALIESDLLARWELAAGREATAALAHAEAAAHYEAALAATPRHQRRRRAELLLALGHARDRAGRRSDARAAFAEAAGAGERDLLPRAALGHGGMAVVVAAADPANVGLLEQAIASAAPDEHATRARLLARLSVELYYADPVRARELSAHAVELAAGDPAALAAALNARRVALWQPHHAEERLAAATEMVAAAEQAGDREAILQGRNWRVVDLLELGRVTEVAAEIDAYAQIAVALGLPHFTWYVPLWRGTLALLAGRWEEGTEHGKRALELARQADDPNGPLFVGIQHASRLYLQRRFEDMDRERLVSGAAASPAPVEWLVNVALLDAKTGDIAGARRMVADLARDRGSALAMDANWHAACILAEAAALVGDREAGESLYALLEPHARLFPIVARAVACLGSAELYVGLLAALLGRPDEAEERLLRAMAENERAGALAQAAMARRSLEELVRG